MESTPATSPVTSLPWAIHASDIHRTFTTAKHTVHAVDGVSLDIAPGEITALLGHNGAGKSTLIDVILGLGKPHRGTVELFGMAPRQAIRKALVGAVFQSGALVPELTVLQTLKMLKATYLETPPLKQILEETELTELRHRRVAKLSGGEAQRLRLAIALLPNPWLLILDEPTAGMDAMMRRRFWKLMEHQAEAGRTIVFATHYLQEAQDFAIRTVIMNHGKITVDGATTEVQRLGQSTTVSIDMPGVFPSDLKERWNATLTPLRHANAEVHVEIKTNDSDHVARELLALPGAHHLTVVPSTLEDVFAAFADEEATHRSDSGAESKKHSRGKKSHHSDRHYR